MQNDEFELSDGSYPVSIIWDYFEYAIKKRMTDNKIRMYANKTESKITFKIKARSYLELLTPETIKLIGGITIKMTEEKNGKNIPYL